MTKKTKVDLLDITLKDDRAAVIKTIQQLQKRKDFENLGKLFGLTVRQGHTGWGWRGYGDQSQADDLFSRNEAWEAACFEFGLMEEDIELIFQRAPDEMLEHLGIKGN